jgi:hypothetical protein
MNALLSSRAASLSLLLLSSACQNPEPEQETPPPPPESGCAVDGTCSFSHEFAPTTLKPGEERTSQCYTYKLGNPTDLLINTVELVNDGGFHHSNWFFVPEKAFDTEESTVRCHDIGFTELGAALQGGVLFAQSTQSRTEAQRFPPGAILRVPAHSRIITSAHLLNPGAKELSTGMRLTLHTLPESQKKVELVPFRLSYTDLHIPAMKRSEFTGECELKKESEILLEKPFYMKLYYVLPHFHAWGDMFKLELVGGPSAGSVLYELRDGIGEAHGQTYDPPLDISAAAGLRFTCGYSNTTNKEIRWGNGNGEMCVMLGFADSAARYDGNVNRDKEVGEHQGVSLHSGPCGIAVYPVEQ